MPVAVAERETVSLTMPTADGLGLDLLGDLADIVASPAHLDGGYRFGGNDPYAWLEPAPGVPPFDERRVELLIAGQWGGSTLPAPAQIFHIGDRSLLRAVYYTLTVVIGERAGETAIRWWLEPGGDDATWRTDALDFLEALHKPGLLAARDAASLQELFRAPLLGGESFDSELANARDFLQQVAVLEEWSGSKIPVPEEVSAERATDIARASAIVHARQVPLVIGEELTVTLANATIESFDELRLPRQFSAEILGVDVSLGETILSVAVDPVAVDVLDEGVTRVRCRLADSQPRETQVHLYPPSTRHRLVRRTLVAGAPVPPRPDLIGLRLDTGHLASAERYLTERDSARGLIPKELLAEIEEKWPE